LQKGSCGRLAGFARRKRNSRGDEEFEEFKESEERTAARR
jgi:hypothetical protein